MIQNRRHTGWWFRNGALNTDLQHNSFWYWWTSRLRNYSTVNIRHHKSEYCPEQPITWDSEANLPGQRKRDNFSSEILSLISKRWTNNFLGKNSHEILFLSEGKDLLSLMKLIDLETYCHEVWKNFCKTLWVWSISKIVRQVVIKDHLCLRNTSIRLYSLQSNLCVYII